MTAYYPRSAWTSTARPVGKLVRMDPGVVRGVAVHYTGSTSRLGQTASLALSARRLEGERAFHVDGRGWSDIAYGAAIDVGGRIFDCRGLEYRSAANGNATVNQQYGAVTWLLGVGDTPTPAMVEAFKDWRTSRWLKAFPHATAVVGHRDLYSTDCPGAPAYALVRSGELTKAPGGDMPLSEADVAFLTSHPKFESAIINAVWNHSKWPVAGGTINAGTRLALAANGPDAAAIAAAVVAALPTGSGPGGSLTVADVEAAVRDVLRTGTEAGA